MSITSLWTAAPLLMRLAHPNKPSARGDAALGVSFGKKSRRRTRGGRRPRVGCWRTLCFIPARPSLPSFEAATPGPGTGSTAGNPHHIPRAGPEGPRGAERTPAIQLGPPPAAYHAHYPLPHHHAPATAFGRGTITTPTLETSHLIVPGTHAHSPNSLLQLECRLFQESGEGERETERERDRGTA